MPRQRLPDRDFAWTQRLAYAVGLLVTDGNLSSDGRHINMRSKEIPMLKTFQSCLGIHNAIGKDTKWNRSYYRVQFSDAQFYRWLLKVGLFPAKSCTIGAIAVPDDFFRDFFRGCIDGDGNIRTYRNRYNQYRGRRYTTQSLFIRLTSASEKHIRWMQGKVLQLAGVHGAILRRLPRTSKRVPLWILQFAKKESLKIIEWMYHTPHVPCLKRKRRIAQRALTIIQKQKRRPYRWIADKTKCPGWESNPHTLSGRGV